jgi:hypothetical protein
MERWASAAVGVSVVVKDRRERCCEREMSVVVKEKCLLRQCSVPLPALTTHKCHLRLHACVLP